MKTDFGSAKENRQVRILELRIQGLTPKRITRQLFTEGLLVSKTFKAGYALVRKDLLQLRDQAAKNDPSGATELARDILLERLEILYQRAYAQSLPYDKERNPQGLDDPRARVNATKLTAEIAEKIAAVQRVNTRPRFEIDMNVGEKLSPEQEAAEAVIQKQRERERALSMEPSTEPEDEELPPN